MDFKQYKNYFRWGVTAFGVVASSLLFYFILFHFSSIQVGISACIRILSPLLIGLIIAFCLCPILNIAERRMVPSVLKWLKITPEPKQWRTIRALLITAIYLIVIACLYGLISALIPEIISSFGKLLYRFPYYQKSTERMLNKLLSKYPDIQSEFGDVFVSISDKVNDWITNTLLPAGSDFVINVSGQVVNAVSIAFKVLVGAIIAIYLLYHKERYIGIFKRMLYTFFSTPTATGLIRDLKYINREFSGFLTGKVIDSIIIGIICYVITSLIGTPYALLVSLIIGVTNIIPFFGPFLGAIPCTILILMIKPIQGLYFLIFILILQQFDGNFLGPKILGRTTGVSSFLIIISILIGSGLGGIFGMVIAVPICGIICTIYKNRSSNKLKSRRLPEDDDFYIHHDYIDPETNEGVPLSEETPVIDEEQLFRFHKRQQQNKKNLDSLKKLPIRHPFHEKEKDKEKKTADEIEKEDKIKEEQTKEKAAEEEKEKEKTTEQ